MSNDPKANASEAPAAKNEELEAGEVEKISGGVPASPPKQAFEIKDFSFDVSNPTTIGS